MSFSVFCTGGREVQRQMFSVRVRPVAGAVVLQLRGELDVESVVQLDEATKIAVRSMPALVVVDGEALSFCDSSGISGFVRLYQLVSAHGGRLRVAAVPASVAKVFSLTGLDTVIPVHITTDEALAAVPDKQEKTADDRAGTVNGEGGV
ncbi:STAS domain-containing protein [Streptomyces sp. NPDC001910]|uniref:STAS domain-containing protein n=1 Tax=Streptomyces sp. NPDC001910 TaxID=3154403 RepID=UPI00331F0EE5